MPKVASKILSVTLLGTNPAINDSLYAAEPAAPQPPAASASIEPGTDVKSDELKAAHQAGFVQGLKYGEQLGEVKAYLGLLSRNMSATSKAIQRSNNPEYLKDWSDDSRMIKGNLEFIAQKLEEGKLDPALAIRMLEMICDKLDSWNEIIIKDSSKKLNDQPVQARQSRQVPERLDPNDPAGLLESLVPDPRDGLLVYRPEDAAALRIFRSWGLPQIKEVLPQIVKLKQEIQDPESEYKKAGGLVQEYSKKLTEEQQKAGPSVHEIRQRQLEEQRKKLNQDSPQ